MTTYLFNTQRAHMNKKQLNNFIEKWVKAINSTQKNNYK